MRDRLKELHDLVGNNTDSNGDAFMEIDDKKGLGINEDEELELPSTAAIFHSYEKEPIMEPFHKEVDSLYEDIAKLHKDVQDLSKHNARILHSVRRLSSIKRDANSIAKEVRGRAQRIHRRIKKLEEDKKASENQSGVGSVEARIMELQTASLTRRFQEVMLEYSQAETRQRDNCRQRIMRQMEILGDGPVSEEDLDEHLEKGNWDLFTGNLILETKAAKEAFGEIEKRHQELLQLEQRISQVHELFGQVAILVQEHGDMINNIENSVCRTQDYVAQANTSFTRAKLYQRRTPFRRIMICCCPCLY
uniref:Syntaxin 11 n=1 Tax=Eptatretus burgeri TaxID=7764 RepID=A0A8C4Q7B3_EPTBU